MKPEKTTGVDNHTSYFKDRFREAHCYLWCQMIGVNNHAAEPKLDRKPMRTLRNSSLTIGVINLLCQRWIPNASTTRIVRPVKTAIFPGQLSTNSGYVVGRSE